jgi:hypothetical protein
MAQTSVEWLENQLTLALGDELKDLRGLFVVAKEMHEKEIKDAYGHGQNNGYQYRDGGVSLIDGEECRVDLIDAEEYYQQTFKTQ